MTISGDPAAASFTLDDLTFTLTTPVLAPTTLLLGSGLAGLVGFRRCEVRARERRPRCLGGVHRSGGSAGVVGYLNSYA